MRLPVWAFYSAAAVVAILFVVHARTQYRRMVADWHFRTMDFASVKGKWKTVVVEGSKASGYDPRRKKTLVTVAGGHIRLAGSDRTKEAKRGRLENAAAMLKEVVRAYPCNLKAYNHLGVAYMQIAEMERKASPARFKSGLDESLAYFKSALEIRPEYADVHNNLASVYDKLKKPDEAVWSLGRAIWYDQENPMLLKNMAIAWTKRKTGPLLFGADLSLRSDLVSGRLSDRFLRGFKDRRVSLSKRITISREKEGGLWRISDLGTGRTYFAEETGEMLKVYVKNDLDKALFHYRRAVEVRSLLFNADTSLRSDLESGRLSDRFLRRFKERRVSLSKNIAISRHPSLKLRRSAVALAKVGRGKEGGPWRISDLGTGRTYFAEETGEALRVYVQKDDASIYGAIAGIHMSRGEAPEALRNYRLAAKLEPRNATYQHERGVSAFRARRYREAKVAFQNTLRLKSGWALAHKNLGMVQIGYLGEKDEGIRHLKAALRLNPKVAGAAKVRDLLKRYGAAP